MELKLPPVVVLFIFGLLMYLLDRFLPIGGFDFFGRLFLAKILLGLAATIGMISVIQFFRAKTSVDPTKPDKATNLVAIGLFAYTRNPMYLSLLLILLALALRLGNAFNILLAVGFVSYMNRFQIIPEEKALAKLFDKEFQMYCEKVRRWF